MRVKPWIDLPIRSRQIGDSGPDRFEQCGHKLYHTLIPSGANSQGAALDRLQSNLREVIAMRLEDGELNLEPE